MAGQIHRRIESLLRMLSIYPAQSWTALNMLRMLSVYPARIRTAFDMLRLLSIYPAQIRTAFNMLGPLLNPAHASYGLIGIYSPSISDLMATALQVGLGFRVCGLTLPTGCGLSLPAHDAGVSHCQTLNPKPMVPGWPALSSACRPLCLSILHCLPVRLAFHPSVCVFTSRPGRLSAVGGHASSNGPLDPQGRLTDILPLRCDSSGWV
jgi:Glycosyl transferase family, a/b domain